MAVSWSLSASGLATYTHLQPIDKCIGHYFARPSLLESEPSSEPVGGEDGGFPWLPAASDPERTGRNGAVGLEVCIPLATGWPDPLSQCCCGPEEESRLLHGRHVTPAAQAQPGPSAGIVASSGAKLLQVLKYCRQDQTTVTETPSPN